MCPTITQKLWTGGLLESHHGDSLHTMAYPLRVWCRYTHSSYDCLDSHGEDNSSQQSICDGLLPNLCSKKNKEKCLCVQGSHQIFMFIALILFWELQECDF